MANPHVISALSKKGGELIGSIRHYKQLIKSLDAVIRIFKPDSTKVVNKHKRNKYFENGEAKTLILDTLKVENKSIRTDDLSDIVMQKKNLAFEEDYEIRNFRKSIINALTLLEKENLVQRVDK